MAQEMARIYVIEDDQSIRIELMRVLEREGYEAQACDDFAHAAECALAAAPDLVLLDLTLPATDGQLVCREIRASSDVPIVVLTSRTSEADEVVSMTLGADDFIPKPYSARILLAHISALLRRVGAASATGSVLEHNGLVLDLSRSEVRRAASSEKEGDEQDDSACEQAVELTKNELRILALLIRRAGCIVSREELMRELWDSDVFIDDNTLTVNINRLRTTLSRLGIEGYLLTHRGQGYSV